jgi:hypothetical protein
MCRGKSIAQNLTHAAIVNLLLIVSCWAQKPEGVQSAVPPLPADVPGDAERYSVLIVGNLAGQQAVWKVPDGSLHIFYQFNDRGRGPKTTSILKLDAKGVPVAESIEGNDYLKSPVHERYALEGGKAGWKSNVEEGGKKLSTPAVYVSINGAPAELGVIAQAALSNGGKVALLPEGEATTERLAQIDVEAAGRKKRVTMYAITGLDFSPTYVWLDEDRQDKAKQERAAELAGKLAHRLPNGVLFEHVNLFDSQSGEILKDRSVVVAGNRIVKVGPSDQVTPPAGAEVINAAGKTLLPGLWDMHAHVEKTMAC